MQTYYTVKLMNEDLSVKDFIYICSYQFGAFSHLRDSSEAERETNRIPKVSKHHENKIEEKKKELKTFLEKTTDELKAEFEAWKKERTDYYIGLIKENKARRDKLKTTLDKLRDINFPEKHILLKKFCISQVHETSAYYTDDSYYTKQIAKIKSADFRQWEQERIGELHEDIKYHQKAHDEEVERVEKRIEWIKELDEFLETLED